MNLKRCLIYGVNSLSGLVGLGHVFFCFMAGIVMLSQFAEALNISMLSVFCVINGVMLMSSVYFGFNDRLRQFIIERIMYKGLFLFAVGIVLIFIEKIIVIFV